ncbi:amidase [Luteimicrobium subarcticum]|uniref:Amidase n=1 Tax=Luteimicrobium subarcticum TaxID=620910 RepID=A0A2M8WUU8_9MICO|nr:amidase [Luteimicrobium subarcticum]PJI94684.1 amidase [Luteimicrobium subarcticum]
MSPLSTPPTTTTAPQDHHDLPALDLAAALRSGDLSPAEVLDSTLDRASDIGERVGAFVTLAPELARTQARDAERRLVAARRSGRDGVADLPPFLGVPCPVKDLDQVAGVPMAAGSRAFDGFVPDTDDGVVSLLRAAGTVMVGKTSTPELGLPCYTEPDVGPTARTPWDLTRSAGGSSGGAAAAVAARIVPVAQGSDGGGSIRIPASACGLVGLKPSRGRVSPGPAGVDGPGLGVAGVLTRTVRDTAAFLDVLAQPWPGDWFSTPPGPPGRFLAACDADPGRLRVGVLTQPVIVDDAPVADACLAAAEQTARLLADLGHTVDAAPVPFPAEAWSSFEALWAVGALSAPVPPEREHLLRPLTRWLRETGRATSGLAYAQAASGAQRITRQAAAAWASFDVVLTPTLAQLPAPVGSIRDDDDPAADFLAQCRFTPWTSVANLTGRPSVSLPLHRAAGAAEGGGELPVGVMLTGRWADDARLLSLAAQLEAARPWTGPAPTLPGR